MRPWRTFHAYIQKFLTYSAKIPHFRRSSGAYLAHMPRRPNLSPLPAHAYPPLHIAGHTLIFIPAAAAADDRLVTMLALQPWRAFMGSPMLLAVVVSTLAIGATLLLLVRARRQRRGMHSMRSLLYTYMTALDAIPMPIYMRNRALELTACNTAYAQACGQPRHVLNLASIETAMRWMGADTLDAHELERLYRHTINSGRPAVEDRTVRLHAGWVTLQHWTQPLRDGRGDVIGVIGGWLDVTERQRALTELAQARDRAEAALRAKSTFLASISHDIRTPMNAIMGMLELTLHGSLATQERQQLEAALQSARSLLSLIDDLLDLSRVEAGKLSLRPTPTSLRDVAAEITGVFAPVARSKEVALNVAIAPSVAGCHMVDPLRLKQILNNLVSNAIRFTAHGHIHLEIKAAPIRDGHQWVQFSITDTGIGIAPEALPVLFQPFMQMGASAANGGVGLGLPICKRLVDAMDGDIRISSQLDQGTRAIVRLRLPVNAMQETATSAKPGAHTPILVVDDHASNRILLKRQLQKLGHHDVVCTENGLQALEAIERQVFKLAICDCSMPQMNGMEFVQTLRSRPGINADIPVLGYTAGAEDDNVQDAIAAGMNAVLLKPVSLAELRVALQTHLPMTPRAEASVPGGAIA
nr:ATP-binding protein [Bordetella petrii]